ncbi:hypothetical protein, variant [Salpingoeca rosetta]|uniref:Uncharacterized protein n=1 Tax=Salpingoeca rosetta (strain ATCC 50818 / BSB-021) TaxID=946362 RepID=F2U146_SALR5|nr:hypothetical protein, variant [Salpingoeca rosetta]EGD80619.1 hypothetical protein, variant [Salpingoeca rosetta]|eukprot:XP_004997180.1 hypothetical protein, variant [Salpingoeca rosetta]
MSESEDNGSTSTAVAVGGAGEHGEHGELDAVARIAAFDVDALFASHSGTAVSGSQTSLPALFSPERSLSASLASTLSAASSSSSLNIATPGRSSGHPATASAGARVQREGYPRSHRRRNQPRQQQGRREEELVAQWQERWQSNNDQHSTTRQRADVDGLRRNYEAQVHELEDLLQSTRLDLIQLRQSAHAREDQLNHRIHNLSDELESYAAENRRLQSKISEERKQWQHAVDEATQRFDNDRQQIEQERERLRVQVAELSTALETSRQEAASANAAITRLKKQDARLGRISQLEEDLQTYHVEMTAMKSALDRLTDEYTTIDREHAALQKRHQQATHDNKLLTQDKTYLEKQLAREQNTVSILNSQLSDLQVKLRSSEAKTREAKLQLDTQLAEQRRQLEENVATQLAEMKRKNDEEMDNIKRSNESVQLRELDMMRRDREQAMHAHAVAQAKLQALERKHVEEVDNLKNQIRDLESQLTNTHAEGKLKSFEHDRTTLLLEEKQQQVQSLEMKVDRLQQECKVVREEYQRLEVDSQQRIATLRAQLDDATTKINAFTKLEDELDQVVMAAAESSDPHKVFLSFGYGRNTQRRVQKTVDLARQVLEARRAQAEAQEREKQLRSDLAETQQQLRDAQALVNNASQPLSYFLHMLEEKDERLREERARVEALEQERVQLEQTQQQLIRERDALNRHAVIGKRHAQHLRNLRANFKDMLSQLQDQGETSLATTLTQMLRAQAR